MNRDDMIRAIEGEIARLKQVRDLLLESTSERFTAVDADAAKAPRVLSADARRRIAQAQKRRWAKERGKKALPVDSDESGA